MINFNAIAMPVGNFDNPYPVRKGNGRVFGREHMNNVPAIERGIQIRIRRNCETAFQNGQNVKVFISPAHGDNLRVLVAITMPIMPRMNLYIDEFYINKMTGLTSGYQVEV